MNVGRAASLVAVVLLILFCVFILRHEKMARNRAQLMIERHGKVIANSLWNFNPEGAAKYLSLACKSQNYQHAIVTGLDGRKFQMAEGNPPSGVERLFTRMGLVPHITLCSDIRYEGKPIGDITAVWRCDTIYPEVTVLAALVLVYFILLLYAGLIRSKHDLKDRVAERTDQLSRLNISLQNKVKDEQNARAALLETEKRYRLIAENVADVIWIADMELNFTYVSPSVYQLRGDTVKQAMELPLTERLTPASVERAMALFEEKMSRVHMQDPAAWEPVVFEARQYRKDGRLIWISNSARLLKGPDNQPEGILGVTRDITAQKQAEIKKIQAERHAADQEKHALVGRIAGKMSHDFNNILSVIMGNAELSLLDCDNERIRHTLKLILGQTEQGKNLTKNLTAFAKDLEPRQTFFRLDEKIDLVLNLMKKDLGDITPTVKNSPDLPLLMADPGMIEHTLINLLQNSIHALSLTPDPEIVIQTGSDQGTVRFEVHDNGCGIPAEHMDRIYDPSFTLKGSRDITGSYKPGIKGTGYGMANIKRYIEQHNGTIDVESQKGAGTRITISLPRVKTCLTHEEKAQVALSAQHIGKRILLVEDEKAISDIQFRVLTQPPCSHKVDVAASGRKALELFNSRPYDAVSLDYILPGHLNGMGVYNEIRKTSPKIPILFISGNIEFLESIKELKLKDPFIDHLSKPCKNVDYANSINGLFSGTRLHYHSQFS